jgi:drug/metabolite transporter (DMT)-like permease
MQLSLDQVRVIERHVQSEGITYSHLEYDLLDHICCDIEDRMRSGITFNEAYQSVRQDIGSQGLRRVQQETLLLINKNYRMMKKSMKTLGTIALAGISVAALAKIMHWPGASLLITLSFLLVSTVFFPAALYVWYKEVFNRKQLFIVIMAFLSGFTFMVGTLFKIQHWPMANMFLSIGELSTILTLIIGGISYLVLKRYDKNRLGLTIIGIIGITGFFLGTLFKIQHWPGATILLVIGAILLFSIFLPVYAYHAYKEEKTVKNSFIFSIYALTSIIAFTFLLTLNVSRNILGEFVYTNTELYNSIAIAEGQINAVPQSSPETKEINLAANDLFNSISNLKKDFIISAGGIDINTMQLNTEDLKYSRFTNLDKNTFKILADTALNNKMYLIYNGILDYKSLLLKNTDKDSPSFIFIDHLLASKQEKAQEWIMQNFYKFPLIMSLNNLTQLQLEIRLAQQETLSSICKAVADIQNENIQN